MHYYARPFPSFFLFLEIDPIKDFFTIYKLTVLFAPRFLTVHARIAVPPSTVVKFLPPSPVSGSNGVNSKKGRLELEPEPGRDPDDCLGP